MRRDLRNMGKLASVRLRATIVIFMVAGVAGAVDVKLMVGSRRGTFTPSSIRANLTETEETPSGGAVGLNVIVFIANDHGPL